MLRIALPTVFTLTTIPRNSLARRALTSGTGSA
jgi:hypothetical protein